jgi:hypothetical protein
VPADEREVCGVGEHSGRECCEVDRVGLVGEVVEEGGQSVATIVEFVVGEWGRAGRPAFTGEVLESSEPLVMVCDDQFVNAHVKQRRSA